jgi:hypothetical protein
MQKVAELEAEPGLKRPVIQSRCGVPNCSRKPAHKERTMGSCGDELVVMDTSGLTDADWAVMNKLLAHSRGGWSKRTKGTQSKN